MQQGSLTGNSGNGVSGVFCIIHQQRGAPARAPPPAGPFLRSAATSARMARSYFCFEFPSSQAGCRAVILTQSEHKQFTSGCGKTGQHQDAGATVPPPLFFQAVSACVSLLSVLFYLYPNGFYHPQGLTLQQLLDKSFLLEIKQKQPWRIILWRDSAPTGGWWYRQTQSSMMIISNRKV